MHHPFPDPSRNVMPKRGARNSAQAMVTAMPFGSID